MSKAPNPTRGATAIPPAKPARPAPIVFARGPIVVVESGAAMPGRCIRCNAAATGRPVRQRLVLVDATHRENLRLFRMIPFVGGVARLMYRWKHRGRLSKSTTVELPLCQMHKFLRVAAPIFPFIGLGGGLLILRIGFDAKDPNPVMILAAFASLVVGVLLMAWANRTVRAHQILPDSVSLAGAGGAFIASLPPDPKPAANAASAVALAAAVRRRPPQNHNQAGQS